MGRGKNTLDPEAVKAADKAFYDRYKDKAGKKLTREFKDKTLREEWMKLYKQAREPKAAPATPPSSPVACCPDPSPCSNSHPCRGQGLDKKENRDEFMADMKDLKEKMEKGGLSAGDFQDALKKATNKQLAKAGVPEMGLDNSSRIFGLGNKLDKERYGEYSFTQHEMTINKDLLPSDPKHHPSDYIYKNLIGTVYHEARHAEQHQKEAQFLAGEGKTKKDLESMGFTSDVAEAAVKNPAIAGSPEANCGKAIYESHFGSGKAHREKVLVSDAKNVKDKREKADKEQKKADKAKEEAEKKATEAKANEDQLTRDYWEANKHNDGFFDPAKSNWTKWRLEHATKNREAADKELSEARKRKSQTWKDYEKAVQDEQNNYKEYESLPGESDAFCQSNIIERDFH